MYSSGRGRGSKQQGTKAKKMEVNKTNIGIGMKKGENWQRGTV
jgi:hypothetical protein